MLFVMPTVSSIMLSCHCAAFRQPLHGKVASQMNDHSVYFYTARNPMHFLTQQPECDTLKPRSHSMLFLL